MVTPTETARVCSSHHYSPLHSPSNMAPTPIPKQFLGVLGGIAFLFMFMMLAITPDQAVDDILPPPEVMEKASQHSPLASTSTTPAHRLTKTPRGRGQVPVGIHVMSKCPDAIACEAFLPLVLDKVGAIVNLTVDYIATPYSQPEAPACMHGPAECEGNTQQLCFAQTYPDRSMWYDFILCQNQDWHSIPDRALAASCAIAAGGVYEGAVEDCVSGPKGLALLAASTARTRALEIRRSCTIRIAGKIRCIRDGGVWKDCEGGSEVEDFVRDICHAFHGRDMPAACHRYM
jgi:hypothetical protein